jgi:hypothetical protein
MGFVLAIPLLVVVLAVYHFMVFVNPNSMTDALPLQLHLPSGADLTLTGGNLVVMAGLLLLFVEVLKSARSGNATIADHMLSTLVFIVALVDFLLFRPAGTSVFLTLMVICLIDVVAGFTVSIRQARRDIAYGGRGDY